MPTGRRLSSTTAIEATRSRRMATSASRTAVPVSQCTGSRRTMVLSGSSSVRCSTARWLKLWRNWPSDCCTMLSRIAVQYSAKGWERRRSDSKSSRVSWKQNTSSVASKRRAPATPAASAATGKHSPGPRTSSSEPLEMLRTATWPRWMMCRCSAIPAVGSTIVVPTGKYASLTRSAMNSRSPRAIRENGMWARRKRIVDSAMRTGCRHERGHSPFPPPAVQRRTKGECPRIVSGSWPSTPGCPCSAGRRPPATVPRSAGRGTAASRAAPPGTRAGSR